MPQFPTTLPRPGHGFEQIVSSVAKNRRNLWASNPDTALLFKLVDLLLQIHFAPSAFAAAQARIEAKRRDEEEKRNRQQLNTVKEFDNRRQALSTLDALDRSGNINYEHRAELLATLPARQMRPLAKIDNRASPPQPQPPQPQPPAEEEEDDNSEEDEDDMDGDDINIGDLPAASRRALSAVIIKYIQRISGSVTAADVLAHFDDAPDRGITVAIATEAARIAAVLRPWCRHRDQSGHLPAATPSTAAIGVIANAVLALFGRRTRRLAVQVSCGRRIAITVNNELITSFATHSIIRYLPHGPALQDHLAPTAQRNVRTLFSTAGLLAGTDTKKR
jgi:ribosomal protein L12E/L44/L45/RPP1/RPP2